MATYSDIIKGLEIFRRIEGDKHLGGAGHDVIYGADRDIKISEEDAVVLEDAGWHLSSESDGWQRFV